MYAKRPRLQERTVDCGDRFKPIVVVSKNSPTYYKTKQYDEPPGLHWIEISVYHEGVLNYSNNPQQLILDGLFKAVDGEEFYPVNYKCGHRVDTFLARNCKKALDKLFKQRLTIELSTGANIKLGVDFNVATYRTGQIVPVILISQVVTQLMDKLDHFDGVQNVLNLTKFGGHQSFRHVIVRLSNLATLKLVCNTIYNYDQRRSAIRGFSFACNQISDLSPLKLFGDVDYELLDLTGNRLRSAVRLCSDLMRVRAKKLNLADNPLIKRSQYPDCLQPLRKNFQFVDGIPFDKLYKTYTPLNYEVDLECDGTRIDWSNKFVLEQFRHSEDWHAFVIPDAEHEIKKETLFDFIAITLNPEASDFYPCYYKFDNGVHSFLVRKCFDQINYLVQNHNMELKIPELVTTEDGVEQVQYNKSLVYYLRMKVSSFKDGHLVPTESIKLATQKRYSAINRMLDLSNFQQTDGLDKITVMMTSPSILCNILTMASQRFLGGCVELQLQNNKIVSAINLRNLSLMTSLQALDLSNNWITDLSEINSLHGVPLKSLRLHGNPLCGKFSLPSEYIRAVLEVFPTLKTLDDVDLGNNPGLEHKKNFLCNIAGYEYVSKHFLPPYLREFEKQDDRVNLLRYYTDSSIFTMTCSYDMAQCERPSKDLYKRINKYKYHSRNLLKNATDTCRVNVGSQDIIEVLLQLPDVTHDYQSLQTDLMYYDDKMVVISVTGIIRDEPDLLLAFSRQFVLKIDDANLGICQGARRLKIMNDSFSIMNPTKKQVRDAFKFHNLTKERTAIKLDTNKEPTAHEKEQKLLLFQELTGLRHRWCTRIVQDEANWDFEGAIKHFLRMQKGNEIPDDAFA